MIRRLLFCKQYDKNSNEFPLLPPNQFVTPDRLTSFNVNNIIDARWQYQTRMAMHEHKYKKRKYVDGALYTNIFYDQAEIIDINPGDSVDIIVRLFNGHTTTVSAFVEENLNCRHLKNCFRIARKLSACSPNTYRKTTLDGGNMHIVGVGPKGDGTTGMYKLTKLDGVHDLLKELTISAEIYYRSHNLSHLIDQMRQHKSQSNVHSMTGSFVSSITTSHNFINAAHLDVDDKHPCIVTWIRVEDTDLEFWYFILPNVTLDGKRAIVFKIKDGLTISFDARYVMHCSTYKSKLGKTNVYGTFFGNK